MTNLLGVASFEGDGPNSLTRAAALETATVIGELLPPTYCLSLVLCCSGTWWHEAVADYVLGVALGKDASVFSVPVFYHLVPLER